MVLAETSINEIVAALVIGIGLVGGAITTAYLKLSAARRAEKKLHDDEEIDYRQRKALQELEQRRSEAAAAQAQNEFILAKSKELVNDARADVVEIKKQFAQQEVEINGLREEHSNCRETLATTTAQLSAANDRIARLEADLKDSRDRIASLETRLAGMERKS